jgi:hypothetical protein
VNSLKPLIVLAVLGGVGFGVYRALNRGPGDPPAGTDTSATGPLEIKLGEPSALSPTDSTAKKAGPNLLTPAGGVAPPFRAGDSAQNSVAPPAVDPVTPPPLASYGTPQDGGVSPFAEAWAKVQSMLAAGRLYDALREVSAWYDSAALPAGQQAEVQRLLSELAGTVIYSSEHLLLQPYRVQPGEQLTDIAEKHKITPELLAKINGIDPAASAALQPGQELKVVPGPFSAVVDVNTGRLTLFVDDCYAGSFSLAGLGPAVAAKMPAGERVELSVSQKTVAPIYNGPQGEVEPGDPANPLGQHLLALGNELAIHGTNPKAAPQTQEPTGGIRLNEADIVDVYDILTVGSRVIVRK